MLLRAFEVLKSEFIGLKAKATAKAKLDDGFLFAGFD